MARCASPSLLPQYIKGTPENIARHEKRRLEIEQAEVAKVARRENNLAIWGDNCNLEARMVKQLQTKLLAHGIEVLILNDFTHADFLIRPLADTTDAWLPVQLKTTHGLKIRKDAHNDRWRFSNMKGYDGMPVLCCVESSAHRWIANGSIFKAKDVDMTIGNKYDTASTRVDDDEFLSSILVSMLTSGEYSLTTEWAARWDIRRETHLVEMQSIVLWLEHVCLPNGWQYTWPDGQGLEYDMAICKPNSIDWKRVQFKTVKSNREIGVRAAGFTMGLHHQAGYNESGKPTHKPYHVGAADLYVGMRWDDQFFDVWTFNEDDMGDRLASETSKGKTRMSVLLPVSMTDEHVNDGRPGSKGGPPNQAIWTRQHHVRYVR